MPSALNLFAIIINQNYLYSCISVINNESNVATNQFFQLHTTNLIRIYLNLMMHIFTIQHCCAICGTKPINRSYDLRYFHGYSSAVRPCCESSHISYAYPRNKGASLCCDFVLSGWCKAYHKLGRCAFDHDPETHKSKEKALERCPVCTLKQPCYVHFPVLGDQLTEADAGIVTSASEHKFNVDEVVAIVRGKDDNNQLVYAYVIQDDLEFNVTKVAFNARTQNGNIYLRNATLDRSKVFKLRGSKHRDRLLKP